MQELQLGAVEAKFADLIWKNEPVSSGDLVKMCEAAFGWKKSTAFTVLKRLSEKGLFQNRGGNVTSLISRDEFYSLQSEKLVDEAFSGSLPAFFASFTSRKPLTPEEADEIRRLIDGYREKK